MIIVLVYQGQIAGTSDSESNLPSGFKSYRVNADSIDNLWYDASSDSIKPRPAKPGDGYVWINNQWRATSSTNLPIPTPITQLALYKPIYQLFYDKDPNVATFFSYLLSRIENDYVGINTYYNALIKAANDYQNSKSTGTTSSGGTSSTGSSSTGSTSTTGGSTGSTGTGTGTGTSSGGSSGTSGSGTTGSGTSGTGTTTSGTGSSGSSSTGSSGSTGTSTSGTGVSVTTGTGISVKL